MLSKQLVSMSLKAVHLRHSIELNPVELDANFLP